MTLRTWAGCVLTWVMLGGCVTAPTLPVAAPTELLRDASFGPPAERIDPTEIFAVSPAMQRYLRTDIAPQLRSLGAREGLARALQPPGGLQLSYDGTVTRTAAQTFAERAGNCLSLVVLTAALAKELGLPVQFQTFDSERSWSRSAGLYVAAGHVNLTLGRGPRDDARGYDPRRLLTIDFLPPDELRRYQPRNIDEPTVVAMFMNNRAAEAMARQDLDTAYAWARAAVLHNPAQLNGYNTLAVVYLRHDEPDAAERVLRHVLARQPGQVQALANLAWLMQHQGRADEAAHLKTTLARVESQAPFQHFNRGMAALERGDALTAREAFSKELARDPDYHEFHLWAGIAELRLGQVEQARRHLSAALANGPTPGDRALYSAKLDKLKAAGAATLH